MASIVAFMILAMTVSLITLPIAFSQTPGTKKTFAIIDFIPNPVGVGQTMLITVGITDPTTRPQMGWEGLTITVEKPDGTTETLGPFMTDTTGLTGATYVPNQVGTFYLQTHFPEQVVTAEAPGRTQPIGTIMLASSSEKAELVVQQDPIPYYPAMPLPAEYWTRPIDPGLREWQSIAGSWLYGKDERPNKFAPYNDFAPESPHILWRRQLDLGGVVGGEYGDHGFEHGDAYEGKFEDSVIIAGVLYYNRYAAGFTGMEPQNGVYAVDLHTGEELWFQPNIRVNFGQILYWSNYNYHGSYAYIWEMAGPRWNAYDALTGELMFSFENVPSGGIFFGAGHHYGPNGELIRYTLNQQNGWMTKWNSTHAISREGSYGSAAHTQRVFNGTNGIMWNVTIPTGLPGGVQIVMEDRLIGTNLVGTLGAPQPNPVFWAISLAPGQEGRLMYNVTWQLPIDGIHACFPAGFQSTKEDGVFLVVSKETRQYWGFDIDTGRQKWGPTTPLPPLNAFSIAYPAWNVWGQGTSGYGKLVAGGMGGRLMCVDLKTGEELWTYDVTDPYQEILWSNNWPAVPVFITDGKVYVSSTEHSVINPIPRGSPFLCLDLETGEEIFRVDSFLRASRWGGNIMIGDSIIVGDSTIDNHIYAIGRGPSATTALIRSDVVTLGGNVLIQGMVTDISPGTEAYGIRARFPNGVPAVADESMGEWMKYVYMQYPHPADVAGVTVDVHVLDENGNYRAIGEATTDPNGFFCLNWKPDIPGKYSAIVSFAGTESYYPSYAYTGFYVDEAPPGIPPYPTAEPITFPPTEMYVLYATIVIVIAIAIVAVLLLRKK